MTDSTCVDNYLYLDAPTHSPAWAHIYSREWNYPAPNPTAAPGYRDYEVVSDILYRTMPPPDVDAAWCRIVARERARMGLPDLDTERSAAVLFLADVESATADDLVAEGVYATKNAAQVILGTLAKQGRIRRVGRGVYAWGGGA